MANQQARQDGSKFPALLGHSSVADPSETRRVLATGGSLHSILKNTTGDGTSLDVYIQDQTTDVVDLKMIIVEDTTTLTAPTVVDNNVISVTAGHTITAGEIVNIREGVYSYQGVCLSVATNDITLDTPLDHAYTVAAEVEYGSSNLAVDGSSVTKYATIKPCPGCDWDVVRTIFHILDQSAMDNSLFGGITALTNGIVLRKKNSIYKNIFNVKTNGGFSLRAYDTSYDDKAPAGFYGFSCRRTFGGQNKNGVTIRLFGDNADELQLIIQDDLTDLDEFEVVIQGHVVD